VRRFEEELSRQNRVTDAKSLRRKRFVIQRKMKKAS
jgi:hypothetical protein